MMAEKKVCPILTALMPLTEKGGKNAFSCLEESCAWWVHLHDEKDQMFGMCAIPAIISVRVV